MSAECGAPVISQFLQPRFTNLVKGKSLKAVSQFVSSAYPVGAAPTIEEVLSLVDHSITNGDRVGGCGTEELRKVRRALVYVITEVLSKVWDNLHRDFGSEKIDNPYAMLLSEEEDRQSIYVRKAFRRFDYMARLLIDERDDRNHRHITPELSAEARGFTDTYVILAHLLNHGDTVLTFNYDLFLDLALSRPSLDPELEWDVDYGIDFLELVPDLDITSEAAPLRYVSRPDWRISKRVVRLLKLHGALNWGVCSSCKALVATVLHPLSRVERYIRKLQNDPLDVRKHDLCCPDFSLEPLIVPPTWMKDYDNRYLADIWSIAARDLANADIVVFLGYSFSESDYQVRHLFNKALHMRVVNSWDKVVVVNRSIQNVLPTYQRFFGKVEQVKAKASDYLRQVAEEHKEGKNNIDV